MQISLKLSILTKEWQNSKNSLIKTLDCEKWCKIKKMCDTMSVPNETLTKTKQLFQTLIL
ncbi:hypothetical protein GCM10008929_15210 [Alkalibacterium psychrotolerans]